jgi:UDP-2,4-diacetamido-2,4,6-trideoxy-beta-L-altropyranose hydrolase
MNPGTLLIRADASIAIGTGHVMRCLALAQAWQDAGGVACFAMSQSTPAIQARLQAESCASLAVSCPAGSMEDASQTIAFARVNPVAWIVVDGYQFNAEYQRALKAAGFKVFFLDDYGHASHYSADIVLNQNVTANDALYASREPYTQLFLGPLYCLLRREFSAWSDWKREIVPLGRRVLVTMGGSDPERLTSRAVDALARTKVDGLDVTVVVGGSAHYPELERSDVKATSIHPGMNIRVLKDVTNIAEWMAWSDVAISSAGTTCWELCLMALPALLVDVAENQTALAQELHRRGCAIHLGGPDDFTAEKLTEQLQMLLNSSETRRAISLRCRGLVDGRGATRLTSAMRARLQLRAAQPRDSHLLWEWANDPQVRENAFSGTPIPWEQHELWFADKIKNSDCVIFVAEDDQGRPVGQFRVDWRSDEGEIDVSIVSECRGKGYGSALIDLGVNRAFAAKGQRLHALVKIGNQASRRAFEQAGFTTMDEECVHGEQAIHYVRVKG